MLLMLIEDEPLLVSVAALGAPALPTATLPQVMDEGDAVVEPATPEEAMAVPDTATS